MHMAGTLTQVTLDGMKAAEGNFAHAITNTSQSANRVDNTASTLLSVWKGTAASTFQQAIATWESEFLKARKALQEMHTILQQNTQQYTQTNTETGDTAQQVQQHMTSFPGLPNL
jgi:WXG100 family type VII secretion target